MTAYDPTSRDKTRLRIAATKSRQHAHVDLFVYKCADTAERNFALFIQKGALVTISDPAKLRAMAIQLLQCADCMDGGKVPDAVEYPADGENYTVSAERKTA